MKLGDCVKLVSTGHTYSGGGSKIWRPFVLEYIRRYKPCNASLFGLERKCISIESGYCTIDDLAKRIDLTWKIRCVIDTGIYIISSNKNHMLVASFLAIQKN